MSIQNWSDNIIVTQLQNDPQFTDEVESLLALAQEKTDKDVVVDLNSVSFLNSSNIAKLLKLRKLIVFNNGRKLRLCGISTHIWGMFLVTGLDRIFDFADNLANGLAAVQIDNHKS